MSRSASARIAAALALAGAGALITACSAGGPAPRPSATVTRTAHATVTASTQATASPSASSSPVPSPSPRTAACATSALRITIGEGDGAAGSEYYPLRFTNQGGASCALYGYPGVSAVTGRGGRQLGRPAAESKVTSRKLITVAPGAVAHAILQVIAAGDLPPARCHPATAHALKVYPPGQTAARYVRLDISVCTVHRFRSLSIEPVRSGANPRGPHA